MWIWQFWRHKLEQIALERVPFGPAVRGRFSPACWDTEAFVVNLEVACTPRLLRENGQSKAAAALLEVLGPNADVIPLSGLQRKLGTAITRHLYPNDKVVLAVRRMAKLGVVADHAAVGRTLAAARRTAPEVALAVFATACNGWITDRRMQDAAPRACLFGCGAAGALDDLAHYSCCPRLWTAIAKVAPPGLCAGQARFAVLSAGSSGRDFETMARTVAATLH